MELCCTARTLLCLPRPPSSLLLRICSSLTARPRPFLFQSKPLSSYPKPELRCPGAADSEETLTFESEKLEEPLSSKVGEASYDAVSVNEAAKVVGQSESGDFLSEPVPADEAVSVGEKIEIVEFLSKLNLKLDSADSYYLLLYGASALLALWIASAFVGAIDSIPLFPKLLELVGIGYTAWFSYRYLIFKKNREDLFAKIEDLRDQIIGQPDRE
ncbi:hypothetical protein IEQ34_015490 [Dendrobium chrysotoxum]|uniref:Cyanobacterial aminoacyl-tRNA synthetase CAAD domain-containing protein n=1 Tax=Dendrobium chrysotoxum TaxID=161865 RepID=A0AAV7GIC5_DENCH|nr:hypothetical protein IEQ34_015490 [Dendrobium chrysotoxum]